MSNLIEIYDGVINSELCNYFIDFFEEQHIIGNTNMGMTGRSKATSHVSVKDSEDLVINQIGFMGNKIHNDNINKLSDIVDDCGIDYHNKYMTYGSKENLLKK